MERWRRIRNEPASDTGKKFTRLPPISGYFLTAQGLQGLHGFLAAQGLQGLQGLQGFLTLAAQGLHGLQGLQGFLAAQGLQGLQGFFAPGYFFIACNVSFRIETKVHRIHPGSIMDFQSHPQGWKTSEPTLSANLHLRRLK